MEEVLRAVDGVGPRLLVAHAYNERQREPGAAPALVPVPVPPRDGLQRSPEHSDHHVPVGLAAVDLLPLAGGGLGDARVDEAAVDGERRHELVVALVEPRVQHVLGVRARVGERDLLAVVHGLGSPTGWVRAR